MHSIFIPVSIHLSNMVNNHYIIPSPPYFNISTTLPSISVDFPLSFSLRHQLPLLTPLPSSQPSYFYYFHLLKSLSLLSHINMFKLISPPIFLLTRPPLSQRFYLQLSHWKLLLFVFCLFFVFFLFFFSYSDSSFFPLEKNSLMIGGKLWENSRILLTYSQLNASRFLTHSRAEGKFARLICLNFFQHVLVNLLLLLLYKKIF